MVHISLHTTILIARWCLDITLVWNAENWDKTLKSISVFGSCSHSRRSLSSPSRTRIFLGDKSLNQYSVTPNTWAIIGKIKSPSSGRSTSLHEWLLFGCRTLVRVVSLHRVWFSWCNSHVWGEHLLTCGQWKLTIIFTACNQMQVDIWHVVKRRKFYMSRNKSLHLDVSDPVTYIK